nr:hypothetical protein [Tanacetum cinerariifolium]
VPIQFELRNKQTVTPLGDHAAHWSSYIGEVIRGVTLYYPSWLKVPKERKAELITDIGTQFDLRTHMESPNWTEINAGIQQHLQKAYNTNKAAFKAQHWVIDPTTGTYNNDFRNIARAAQNRQNRAKSTVISREGSRSLARLRDEMHWVIDPTTGTYNFEKIRRERPENITASEWDKYIEFWNDPRNIARAAQNRQNRAKSTVISRQGSRSLARLRDEMTSTTQEYPSLIDTFFFESGGASGSGGCGNEEEGADHQDDEDEDGDGDAYDELPGKGIPSDKSPGKAPDCRWGKLLML